MNYFSQIHWPDIVASLTGSFFSSIITSPLSTIKVCYQTKGFNTVRETCLDIYKSGGAPAFYRGTSAVILAHCVSFSTKYVLYDILKKYRNTKSYDLSNNMINGFMTGSLASVVSHPVEVLKNYRERGDSFTDEYKRVGARLLYRAYWKAVCKTTTRHTFMFPVFDYSKYQTGNHFAACVITCVVVSSIIEPLDFIKARDIAKQPLFVGYNPLRYYRGLPLSIAKSVPSFTIVMSVTEYVKSLLK